METFRKAGTIFIGGYSAEHYIMQKYLKTNRPTKHWNIVRGSDFATSLYVKTATPVIYTNYGVIIN
jgi:hypothetical protein